jgi:hypothetical protein
VSWLVGLSWFMLTDNNLDSRGKTPCEGTGSSKDVVVQMELLHLSVSLLSVRLSSDLSPCSTDVPPQLDTSSSVTSYPASG